MHNYLPFFFGPQADYYTSVADDLEAGKIRFNEGAFFFGMFWMAYRKMYTYAAVTFTVIMAESALEDWLIPQLSKTFAYSLISNLVIASVIGFVGNRLYITFARRRVAQLTNNRLVYTVPDRSIVDQLRVQGGVSWTGPLVLLLAFICLTAALFYLTM